jgi:DNA-binding transcriptional LysR family regulator
MRNRPVGPHRAHPGWKVETRRPASRTRPPDSPTDVDVAFVRLPIPGQDDLHAEVLLTELRWIGLPAAHPRAGSNDPIPFRDLVDEPFVAALPETGMWRVRNPRPLIIGMVESLVILA